MLICNLRRGVIRINQVARQSLRRELTAAAPILDDNGKTPISQNVVSIADQICQLSLLETGQLTKLLRERLGISDVVMAPAAAAIPSEQEADAATESSAAPVEEKNYFDIKLESIDASSKIKLIKAVKEIVPGINLVTAKKLVESAPCVIKENIAKIEAEEIKTKLSEFGAEIVLE